MFSPKCDPECESRRLRMYIIYLCILVSCIILTICHFVANLIRRRKSKEEAKDYYISRQDSLRAMSIIQLYQDPFPKAEEYGSVVDAFKITTDGVTGMTIEVPDSYPMNGVNGNSSGGGGGDSNGIGASGNNSRSRPLQKIPEEAGVGSPNQEIVTIVDVHNNEKENPIRSAGGGIGALFKPYDRMALLGAPVTIAVSTVSAFVSAQTAAAAQQQSDPLGILGNIGSRPQSAYSAYDISDITSSPEVARRSPKTC